MIHLLFKDQLRKLQITRAKENDEASFLIKEEINKLYVTPEIPVPIEKQLKYSKEVVDCFNQAGLDPPQAAKKKTEFLRRASIVNFVFILLGLFFSVYLSVSSLSGPMAFPILLKTTGVSFMLFVLWTFIYLLFYQIVEYEYDHRMTKQFSR